MAETNAVPTTDEVKALRADIENYLVEEKIVSDYTASALAQYKLDLYNKRGIKFSQIFDTTNDLYFVNTDDEDWNDQNSINLIGTLTISLVFQDFAIARAAEDSQWMDLSVMYRADYDDALKIAKLDVDINDDGTITEDEEGRSGQTFFVR
jgi:hypothetical protein